MEEALTALLLGDLAVRRLVADRIHWGRAPQGVKPDYVVLQVISGRRDYTMQGASGLVDARVQFDSYAQDYMVAKRISEAVIDVLSGCRRTVGGVRIQGGFVDNDRDMSTETDVKKLFRRSADIIIWHSRL